MNTKICTKCGEEKVATTEFFYRHKRGKYGLRGQCKSCYKIYEQVNKEKIKERQKQYRQDNRERRKQYKQANQDRIAEQDRQYREANKEKISKRNKQYRKKNRHLIRQQKAKRRAAKLNQTPDYANHGLIKLIYENCPKGCHVDHMMSLVSGGSHHETNLCYLPASINIAKGAKTIEEFGLDTFNKNVIYWQDHLKKEG